MKQIMKSAFSKRRAQFIKQMASNSIAIFPSATHKVRSKDTHYPFCQDKYFHYLSGFNEAEAVLILLSGEKGKEHTGQSILFCQEKDPLAELWHGKRLGKDSVSCTLGIEHSENISELTIQLTELLNNKTTLYWAQGHDHSLDEQLQTTLQELRAAERKDQHPPTSIVDWRAHLDEMRLIKSADEIQLIQKAVDISVAGHIKAMQSCSAGLMEYQLQANIEHVFAYQGARAPAYSSIVGSGNNACILHYTENNAVLNDGQLVLIDAGAEYQAYAGDLTRTLPINGKFSQAQKELYELVLAAQLAAIKQMVPGSCLQNAQDAAIEVLSQGLIQLKLLTGSLAQIIEQETYKSFFMHGIGHWLGLDVHDVGSYGGSKRQRPFEAGMVLTVEPGLYINEEADVPEQYQGIGIRIEDNILITPKGNKIMSEALPKTVQEIEAIMNSVQQPNKA